MRPNPTNTNAKKPSLLHKLGLRRRPYSMSCDFRADGLGTKGKSLKFMEDPKFQAAWERTAARVRETMQMKAPDIRWRAHIALWAAKQGLALEGDFVECGVFAGTLSLMICDYHNFAGTQKKFWLFDTWQGIPEEEGTDKGKALAKNYNKKYYTRDTYEIAKESFAPYPNCHLVQGLLPETLERAELTKIAYLSIDLNSAVYEKACIEALWPKLVPGAVVLLDDYNFKVCREQQDMWDAFAASKGLMIASMPTGQGILIKA